MLWVSLSFLTPPHLLVCPPGTNLGRAGASSRSLQGLESLVTEYTDLLLLFLKRMFICSKCISFRARPPETPGKHSKGIWQGTSGYCNTDAKQMGPHFLHSIQYKPGVARLGRGQLSGRPVRLVKEYSTMTWRFCYGSSQGSVFQTYSPLPPT